MANITHGKCAGCGHACDEYDFCKGCNAFICPACDNVPQNRKLHDPEAHFGGNDVN